MTDAEIAETLWGNRGKPVEPKHAPAEEVSSEELEEEGEDEVEDEEFEETEKGWKRKQSRNGRR